MGLTVITGFLTIKCSTVLEIVPTQGAIASPVKVNTTLPDAISFGPGIYSTTRLVSEVEKLPSP